MMVETRERGVAVSLVRGIALGAVLAVLATTRARCQSESASFRLQQSTFDGAGQASGAPHFRGNGSVGQESTIGTSASPGFVLQSGFWSFTGSGLVPVYLLMQKNTLDPDDLDLQWTGNNPPYSIYRSADCPNVFASSATTDFEPHHTDTSPPPGPLVCYNVLATAPGPIANPARVAKDVPARDGPEPRRSVSP